MLENIIGTIGVVLRHLATMGISAAISRQILQQFPSMGIISIMYCLLTH